MTLIAPSMLASDFLHLSESVDIVNKYADIFHLDVMDGTFVPNISFGFPVIEAISKNAQKPMDVHLMIVHPEKYIKRFADTGAAMISFHLEAVDDPLPVLKEISACGVKAGLVINPDKEIEALFPYLEHCDFILLMSVFAGFGGQKFIEESIGRVKRLHDEIVSRGLDVKIEVDGGIGPNNSAALIKAGADILVAGSAVFKAQDPKEVISMMRL